MKKALRDLLLDVARGEIGPAVAARAHALLAGDGDEAPAPEKAPIPSLSYVDERRAREAQEEAEAKRRMREAVWAWNREWTSSPAAPFGRCDCGCGYAFRHAEEGECDHWKGRVGPDAHTRENGWRLRRECHEQKDGRRPMPPGAIPFNARRQVYCARAEIPFVPRKERP